eukprot:3720809-Rhodomonas_salina.1
MDGEAGREAGDGLRVGARARRVAARAAARSKRWLGRTMMVDKVPCRRAPGRGAASLNPGPVSALPDRLEHGEPSSAFSLGP